MARQSAGPAVGRLVLVVGPSGAGKDTILRAARVRLEGDPRYVFARRLITRPPDPAREDHEPLDPAEFAARRAAGAIAFWWEAHGYGYGIRADIADALAAGRWVIANVSRTVVDEARRRFPGTLVVSVRASAPVLAARLAARGGEDTAERVRRLARAEMAIPGGPDVVDIVNEGALADAVAAFLAVLRRDDGP